MINRPFEILLIEDNEGDVFLFKESFKSVKSPHRISVCNDGDQASTFLYKKESFATAPSPDLIILDLNLPKKNGLEILKDIKDCPDLKHIPVIVFTSSHSEKDIKKSYQLYANSYIKKPISIEHFRNIAVGIEAFWLTLAELPQ
jgi:chemotaxis family two-component system response regulator Rcp1